MSCRSLVDGSEHAALVCGDVQGQPGVLARLQLQSIITDVFGSTHCGVESSFDAAMKAVAQAGSGVILYIKPQQQGGSSGQSPGLISQELQSYARQQEACSSGVADDDSASAESASGSSSKVASDLREYATGAQMLQHLQIQSVNLLSDQHTEMQRLQCLGVEVQAMQGLLTAAGLPNSVATSPAAAGFGNGARTTAGQYHLNGSNATADRTPVASV